jgi:hypothetical protein
MKAVVYGRYGPPGVLRIEKVERPAPRDDEIPARVRATTVNRLGRRAQPWASASIGGVASSSRKPPDWCCHSLA